MSQDRTYICIDLKSFYASVECRERGLDPLTTNLVVADPERTEKTICLAVSPAMRARGVPGRCRVFQIPPDIDYMMAPPRMQLYIDYSADIYAIYLQYISKEDIHVYSIDEAFMDVTDYLPMYRMSAKELSMKIMEDVYAATGITAACGIGTNLYLAKIALDITADVAFACARCLEERTRRFHVIKTYCVREADLSDPDAELSFTPDGKLDVRELAYTELVLEVPTVLLCSDDCAGLCPVCGNRKPCSCRHATSGSVDERLSILKQLLND